MGEKQDSTAMSTATAFNSVFGRVQKQSMKVQAALAVSIFIVMIILFYISSQSDLFYLFSEVTYSIANLILVYKLTKHKSCSGISLRTQEITAIFVAVRLICSIRTDMDIEFRLMIDSISLISTFWVIYMMRFKLMSSYAKDLDTMPIYYLLVPCFILSLMVNPGALDMPRMTYFISVAWAFSTYVEAVSVLPQLHLIQNSKMVEPFTAHYVFALGLSRFFGFGHWALMIYETGGKNLLMVGSQWLIWLATELIAEIVQTFILADFCYYYAKSIMCGQRIVLPVPV